MGKLLRRIRSVFLATLLALVLPAWAQAASDGQLAETLLAAMPQVSDINKAGSHHGWWPEPAEFLGRLDPATGLRTLVLQSFRLPEQGTRERIMVAISAYVSREAAHARFNDMEPQDGRTYGPAQNLGLHGHEQLRLHSSVHPRGQTLRAQEGRYILRITHWTDGLPLTPAQMTQLSFGIATRLNELDQEKRPLPAGPPLIHLLGQEIEGLGKPMGTAAGPVEWVSFDRAEGENVPDLDLRDLLKKQMRPPIVTLRRWPLSTASSGQVVDAMLFQTTDARSAAKFMVLDRANRSSERLVLSPLPQVPSYMEKESGERGSKKTVVFSKGSLVAVLSCGAPYFYAAKECEAALMELAASILAAPP
jgi:hypothetical protein